jgi:hypothetical protein
LPLRFIIAATAMLMLAACQSEAEKEKACFDRINADFTRESDLASKDGNHAYAIHALESARSAWLIWVDDDRNICDYVTAGPDLERK